LPLLPFFLWESLRGGIDVARRALHPDLPLRPALLRYRTGLAEGAPRIFLVHCVSLLPGTLSAALEGDTLMVQVLDAGAPVEEELAALEARVGRLFASPLGPAQRDG
jgi:multicomponent Na+:H+ antiporter subunit E